jgi:hypothetical protein
MFKAVVEDQPFAFFPRPRFIRDSNESFLWHFQAQMTPDSTICGSTVTEHMSSRMQNTEFYLTSLACRCGCEFFDNFACHRREMALLCLSTSREKLKLLPIAGVFEIFSFIGKDAIFRQKFQTLISDDLPVLLYFHEIIFVRCLNFGPERSRFQTIDVVERSLMLGEEDADFCAFFVNLGVKFYEKIVEIVFSRG